MTCTPSLLGGCWASIAQRRPVGALPPETRLHLFGVKSSALGAILKDGALARRVAGMDSSAWDYRVRKEAHAARQPKNTPMMIVSMDRWMVRQRETVATSGVG